MITAQRRSRNGSSESSNETSSSEDDISSTIIGKTMMNKAVELSLKDDESTIEFQPPLPEYYGKRRHFSMLKVIFLPEEAGESDDDRRLSRPIQSSASGTTNEQNNLRKQQSKKKRKRFDKHKNHLRPMNIFEYLLKNVLYLCIDVQI